MLLLLPSRSRREKPATLWRPYLSFSISRKIITVYGATGNQGGSVVNSLLENKSGDLKIRGITRDPDSDKSQALAARGVDIVKGDGLSKEQMLEAFQGTWTVFLNSNSVDPALHQPGGITENNHGKEVVDAAFEAGVEVLIYSGSASSAKITNGSITSAGMDEKYLVSDAKTKGFKSAVNVGTGWYMENHFNPEVAGLLGGLPYAEDEDGCLTLAMPNWGGDNTIPFISIGDDYGDTVHGGFSQLATPEELVAAVQKASGKNSRFNEVKDWTTIETHGEPEIETVKNLFGFVQYTGGRFFGVPSDVTLSKKLKAAATTAKGRPASDGKLTTVEQFAKKALSAEVGESESLRMMMHALLYEINGHEVENKHYQYSLLGIGQGAIEVLDEASEHSTDNDIFATTGSGWHFIKYSK
ncbi:NmrA family transcriptional regulator [Metarhizium acridum CQMa 102]|uniref:NmrA family transcriptional regulator n=1 Tax=Metarhizium acridum (strain CQMa 102) TaxID=655827 RepID=E9EAX8_METAQ|nr:NmrA family transcriptional regulator [Metarhizium acridum CQMa 102]EFY86909.1 NmrA family transcriptional regulator [Metarhizium acridum CQMa 102]